MGMASSQARLLMLTSRLHDVEYKTQQLQNAKVALATQQDEVYDEYQKALDDTTLTFTSLDLNTAEKTNLAATFNNLFSINRQHAVGGNYLLIDSRGRVVVDDDIYNAYSNFKNSGTYHNLDNAYAFAYYMVEGQRNSSQLWNDSAEHTMSDLHRAIGTIFKKYTDDLKNQINALFKIYTKYHHSSPHDWTEESVNWAINSSHEDRGKVFASLLGHAEYEWAGVTLSDEEKETYNEIVNYFWSKYGSEVFNMLNEESSTNIDGDDYNKEEFNYYVQIYNAIQQHGGCISIDDFANSTGSVADNADWLTAMIECGQLSMETITIDKNGDATLKAISVASDTNLNYTTTSTLDKTALAKAEAKYEHDLKVINRKETKIDNELNSLETERNAISKEFDSVKNVVKENQERTFKIFS